jgi:hypothetical protein
MEPVTLLCGWSLARESTRILDMPQWRAARNLNICTYMTSVGGATTAPAAAVPSGDLHREYVHTSKAVLLY